jgi:hypothetical protein
VWGLIAALAFGLWACGSDDAAPAKRPLEPGGGFKAEAQEGVKATLKIPDVVSPDAALIQGEVSLENNAGDIVVVSVPRACDVQDWVMRDAGGKLVMTKDPVECADQAATKSLAPGAIVVEKIWIYLLPNVMHSGNKYTIDYRFWGQPARTELTAQR